MSAVDYRTERVLITGASSGIGAEFARRLAARGADLVLVARRGDRLEALAAELTTAHGVRVTPLQADLSRPQAGAQLRDVLAARSITVTSVINNAGFGTEGPFHDEDGVRLQDEIALNISAVVDISRTFIEDMRGRGRGFLINVASMAAYLPGPRMAVYAASKAFVLHFTEALWFEYRGSGLQVFALSPGATQTEFFEVLGNDAADGGAQRQTPQEVVRAAMRALDAGAPEPSVISGRRNRAAAALARILSRRHAVMLMGRITARAA
ncbi:MULTISPECIES: SDR family NAD(P)-dependent oxidoreductase [Microbacterium]|uniref:SDR family oxidoreductase n=1 Tax=Microbacterium wangchenii TaxID=2541726 RepID=A0ABX5SVI6_9MICO|nr:MULTISPECIES: SDR family oxidoreductase [Microbacterium]MCK6067828.1 SDR family oxidoreductase [Microbacterium sp. EYE_512]QBR89275.1 SDR family oxidoreductase [Microbacterium wangchenii]TXK10948.1 SDR family oxidoreductase [Microbacterium wangchenii]